MSTGIGSRTDVEAIPTTRPQPRSRIPGTTRPSSVIGDSTSERCAPRHCSAENPSGSSPEGGPPVLVIRMSIGPISAVTDSISAGAASRSLESQPYPAAAPISAATAAVRAESRAVIATRAPSAISSCATARPMPLRGAADERDAA